jgi:hypothetical protein
MYKNGQPKFDNGYRLDMHSVNTGAGKGPVPGRAEGKNPGMFRPPSEDQL